MSRKLLALFVSSTIALAGISTSGWSASGSPQAAAADARASSETRNAPPLTPAGAAGIREAQGAGGNELYILGGFIAVFGLLWLLDSDDDDDDTPSGSGTN